MAKAARGGGAPTKKKETAGYAFRFPKVADEPISRGAGYSPRLLKRYQDVVRPAMVADFGYKNPMTVPKIEKVVLNIGLGEAIKTPKLLEQAFEYLGYITGQRPVVTRAKKSIATFKLRQGMKIGCMVTLRGPRMWEFLDRLMSVALPRTRDFRGISRKAFDGRGNYTLGVREHVIFPEIDFTKVDKIKGMNVTIVTTAKTDPEAFSLLRAMGMPFRQ